MSRYNASSRKEHIEKLDIFFTELLGEYARSQYQDCFFHIGEGLKTPTNLEKFQKAGAVIRFNRHSIHNYGEAVTHTIEDIGLKDISIYQTVFEFDEKKHIFFTPSPLLLNQDIIKPKGKRVSTIKDQTAEKCIKAIATFNICNYSNFVRTFLIDMDNEFEKLNLLKQVSFYSVEQLRVILSTYDKAMDYLKGKGVPVEYLNNSIFHINFFQDKKNYFFGSLSSANFSKDTLFNVSFTGDGSASDPSELFTPFNYFYTGEKQ